MVQARKKFKMPWRMFVIIEKLIIIEKIINENIIDNRWIVPYNCVLLQTFDAHNNLELSSSIKSIKYVCKYIKIKFLWKEIRSMFISIKVVDISVAQCGKCLLFPFMKGFRLLFIWLCIWKTVKGYILIPKIKVNYLNI